MDIRGLQLEIKKGIKQPLYLIIGDDFYLRSEAETLIKNLFFSSKDNFESNQEVYHGSNINFEKFLDSLHTLPFFSSEKLILVKEAEKLNQSHLESIHSFFSGRSVEGLSLVLSFSKADKRKKTLKELLKTGSLVEVKTPYENQLLGWVDYLAGKEKVKLTAQAKSHLLFLVDPSLDEISKALKKLREVFQDEKVDVAQINEVIDKTRVQDIFQICDLIGYGKLTEALQQLELSLAAGQSPIGVLQLIFRHFRILEMILRHKGMRISSQDLASKVGVPKFFLSNYQRQAQAWSLSGLSKVFKSIEGADLSLKSTRLSVESIFSALMLDIYQVKNKKKGSSMASSLLLEIN